MFTEAHPSLFGEEFQVKMKERAEAVKLLHRSQSALSRPSSQPKQFFRGGAPRDPIEEAVTVRGEQNVMFHTTEATRRTSSQEKKSNYRVSGRHNKINSKCLFDNKYDKYNVKVVVQGTSTGGGECSSSRAVEMVHPKL